MPLITSQYPGAAQAAPSDPTQFLDRACYYHQAADILSAYLRRIRDATTLFSRRDEAHNLVLKPPIPSAPTITVNRNCITFTGVPSNSYEQIQKLALDLAHRYKHFVSQGDFDSKRIRRSKRLAAGQQSAPAPLKNELLRLGIAYTKADISSTSFQIFFWWSTAIPAVWLATEQRPDQRMSPQEVRQVIRLLIRAYTAELRRIFRTPANTDVHHHPHLC